MDQETNVLHSVLVATIRPIAAMLLKFGVGYKEFADASKIAFVTVASEEFGIGGRPTTVSRIALMTGLSRKEVKAVKDGQREGTASKDPLTHLPAEVLRRWFTSDRYCDTSGSPRSLAWDGEPGSFSELVRSCGANLSPVAMRAELIRVGAVKQDGAGMLVALRRYFIADSAKDRLAEGIQFGIRPLALTVARNVASVGWGKLRFQRVVDSYSIPPERRPALESEIGARLKQFSEELDDLLSEVGEASGSGDNSAVGVGLFYFEDYDDPSSR
ncbi:MAG: DUF6502 family protein [Gammaproteobacteria bacterium]